MSTRQLLARAWAAWGQDRVSAAFTDRRSIRTRLRQTYGLAKEGRAASSATVGARGYHPLLADGGRASG